MGQLKQLIEQLEYKAVVSTAIEVDWMGEV